MKWQLPLALALVLLSCTPSRSVAPRSVDVPLDTPRDLRGCAAAPQPPPLPRTIQQIGDYTHALARAHEDCSRTLRKLNQWLADKRVTQDAAS